MNDRPIERLVRAIRHLLVLEGYPLLCVQAVVDVVVAVVDVADVVVVDTPVAYSVWETVVVMHSVAVVVASDVVHVVCWSSSSNQQLLPVQVHASVRDHA